MRPAVPHCSCRTDHSARSKCVPCKGRRANDNHVRFFSAARAELDLLENKVLPSLVAALACSFSTRDPAVRFLPIDHAVFGVARDGRTIHDFQFSASARGVVWSKLEPSQIEVGLASGVKIASTIDPKVARFFNWHLTRTIS